MRRPVTQSHASSELKILLTGNDIQPADESGFTSQDTLENKKKTHLHVCLFPFENKKTVGRKENVEKVAKREIKIKTSYVNFSEKSQKYRINLAMVSNRWKYRRNPEKRREKRSEKPKQILWKRKHYCRKFAYFFPFRKPNFKVNLSLFLGDSTVGDSM